jgi:hypothetical protein
MSAVKRAEFLSDKMHIILRDHLYFIIVQSFYAPREDKLDDMKETFYEKF